MCTRKKGNQMAKFCLDPGHGGSDPGAVSPRTGNRECDITLAICLKIKDRLEPLGHEVVLTRYDDRDVAYPGASANEELQARCDVSNAFMADVFLSVHSNSFAVESAVGTETYWQPGSPAGRVLAKNIHDELVALGLVDRGTKEKSHYVTRNTIAVAALVEIAFLSNPDDEAKLADPIWQDMFAQAIVNGSLRFIG
jgi:N-acetylmuramoyl-L-alanine amidase